MSVLASNNRSQSSHADPAESAFTLTRKRVYILPTRVGWMLSGCLATMLLGAINYNNALAYALTFLLGSIALVSIVHTYRNQAGITLRSAPGESVYVGQLAKFELTLSNSASEPRLGLMVRYEDVDDDGESAPRLVRTSVPAADRQRVSLTRIARRRGRMRLGKVTVSNRYPFGIFRAWSVWNAPSDVLVYPALSGEETLPVTMGDGEGEDSGTVPGLEDFAGLRLYQRGDSPRMVHWKAAARSRELPVKVMTGGSARALQLEWAALAGDTEARLSQMALWVTRAQEAGHEFSLRMPGHDIPLASGAAHARRCLTALALFGESADDAIDALA